MTCVAGYTDGREMILMGDSSLTWGDCCVVVGSEPKVWTAGGWGPHPQVVMGGCGTPRLLQVLRYQTEPLAFKDNYEKQEPMKALVRGVEHVREVFLRLGVSRKEDDEPKLPKGTGIILGLGGRWYEIDGPWSISAHALPFAAVGCGSSEALPAIRALCRTPTPPDPYTMLWTAMEVAAETNPHVKPPFVHVTAPVNA